MLKKTFHLACLGGLLLGAGSCPALAASDIAILMPDAPVGGTDPVTLPLAQAWLDAINEEGFNVDVIRDSQFTNAAVAATYKAVILPDSVHQKVSPELISAIKDYVFIQGGKVMIVYDFGALDSNGLFPASAPNPFSSLVGVDYNLYGELYGQSSITPVGLGPIYGMESKLWSLQVAPGKYMLWPTTSATTTTTSSVASATSPDAIPTAYLRTSRASPGGTKGYDAGYIHQIKSKTGDALTQTQINAAQSKKIPKTAVIGSRPNRIKTDPVSYVPGDTLQGVSGYLYGFLTYPTYVTCNLGHTGNIATTPANCTGTGLPYNGTPLLVSDRFGLVAGTSAYGSGNVLFVNLPLSYLKSQTDGMLMHGFIRYFGDALLHKPRLASVPNGIPGMTVNVHVDSQDAIAPINQMDQAGIWKHGPFSVHFTGGPIVNYLPCQTDSIGNPVKSLPINGQPATCASMVANPLGDVVYQRDSAGNPMVDPLAAIGLNIPNNKTAQAAIKKFDGLTGYQVGAHGGWLHDVYGDNAHDNLFDTAGVLVNPSNALQFQPYLPQNKTAVENVVKHATTEYSAPQGNNPKWAVNWLENNGILGMYYLGDTGMGPTRHWREGNLLNQKVWMFPVLPFGLYATFEDFEANLVSPTDVTAWLNKVVDFSVTQGSTRMIYFHPPGAIGYLPSLTSMLSRAKSYANSLSYNFKWYTMTDLSRFMTKRKQVTWKTALQADGSLLFQASHPTDLTGQTWILPKASFSQPVPAASYIDKVTIGQNSANWLVITKSGSSLSFSAKPL
jgi:hypothetical protein